MKKYSNICYKLLCFCNGLVFFAPVALLVRTSKGVTLSQFFLLQALLSLVIFLFEVPTGVISDKIGYKKSIMLSQIMLFFARGIFLFANNIWFFVAEAVIEAVAHCFMSGTGEAYLYEICRQQGKEGDDEAFLVESARAGAWGTAGFIISTVVYSGLYRLFGIDGLIVATEIASAVGILMTILMPKEKEWENADKISDDKEEETSGESGSKHKMKFSIPGTLWKLLLLDAMVGLAGLVINFLYAQKLEWAGIPVEWMTPIILVYSAFDLLTPKVMKIVNKKQPHRVFGIFMFLSAGLFLLLFFCNNWLSVGCMMIIPFVLGIVGMVQYKLENQYIDQIGMEEKRASLLSTISMGNNLLEIVFLLLSAVISTGEGNIMFLFVSVIFVISTFWGTAILRRITADEKKSS